MSQNNLRLEYLIVVAKEIVKKRNILNVEKR